MKKVYNIEVFIYKVLRRKIRMTKKGKFIVFEGGEGAGSVKG